MPKRDRAAYMRQYRTRKKIDLTTTPGRIEAAFDIIKADVRIRELVAEVARLKRELAARQPLDRKAAQAQRDELLRRIQRGSSK
jgi:hypothetical protein